MLWNFGLHGPLSSLVLPPFQSLAITHHPLKSYWEEKDLSQLSKMLGKLKNQSLYHTPYQHNGGGGRVAVERERRGERGGWGGRGERREGGGRWEE